MKRARALGRRGILLAALLVAGGLIARPAVGRLVRPRPGHSDQPVDQLVKNVRAYVAKHPRDSMGPYTLGRIYFLAYDLKTTGLDLPVWREQEAKPGDSNYVAAFANTGDADYLPDVDGAQAVDGGAAGEATLRRSLTQALVETRRAIGLRNREPLYWNALGSILEHGAEFAPLMSDTFGLPPTISLKVSASEKLRFKALATASLGSADEAAKAREALLAGGCAAAKVYWQATADRSDATLGLLLDRCWKEQAIDAYALAFDFARTADIERQHHGPDLGELAAESGARYVALVRRRGVKAGEQDRVAEAEEQVKRSPPHPSPASPVILR